MIFEIFPIDKNNFLRDDYNNKWVINKCIKAKLMMVMKEYLSSRKHFHYLAGALSTLVTFSRSTVARWYSGCIITSTHNRKVPRFNSFTSSADEP